MKRILIIVPLALLLLAGGGALALRAYLTPERLRSETVQALEASTGLPVRLADAQLTLTPPGVALRELSLGPDAEPVLR
ncbi:MAG: hypothetical protein HKN12_00625, partial [Gemmatimonadetes bacterium]|nr:hypothetical protein [Gemmatimonadota bacterium]